MSKYDAERAALGIKSTGAASTFNSTSKYSAERQEMSRPKYFVEPKRGASQEEMALFGKPAEPPAEPSFLQKVGQKGADLASSFGNKLKSDWESPANPITGLGNAFGSLLTAPVTTLPTRLDQGVQEAKAKGENQFVGGLKGLGKGLLDTAMSKPVSNIEAVNNIAPNMVKSASQSLSGSPNLKEFVKIGANSITPADLIPLAKLSTVGKLGKLQNINKAAEVGIQAAKTVPRTIEPPLEYKPSGAEMTGDTAGYKIPGNANKAITPDVIPMKATGQPSQLLLPEAKELPKQQPTAKATTLTGKYDLANPTLQQAQQRLDDAIIAVQNHFGTNQLRTDEMARIKPELGIDFQKLVGDVESAKNIRTIPTASEAKMGRVAGVYDSPINKVNLKQPISINPKTLFSENNIDRPFIASRGETSLPKVNKNLLGGMNDLKNAPSIKNNLAELGKSVETPKVNVNTLPDTAQYITTKTSKTSNGISKNIKKGYTATIDDLYPISEVNKDSYVKAMNTRQVDMIAHRSLTNGLVDKSGNVVNESLKNITTQIPKGKETAFTDYMVNLHAPTWLEQGRKVFPDEAGVTADVARAKAQKYAAENPEFVELGKRVTEYQQSLAKTWLVDTGIMKPETWKGLVEQYPDYIPFQREFADIEKATGLNAKRGFVSQSNPIKKATGSQRNIIDPIETIIERTGQYIKTAKRNDVMNPIVDELTKNPSAYEGIIKIVPPKSATLLPDAIIDVNKILKEEGIDGLISKFNKPWESQQFLANKGGAVEKGGNIVTVMRDGAPVHLEVNDMDLLKALTNLNPQQSIAITRAVGKVTAMMKTLTTGINPVFGLARNVWRDLVTGYVNSNTLNANPLGYAQYMWDLMKATGNTIAEPLGNSKFLPETFQSLFKKGGEPMAYFKNIGGGGHVSSISSDRNLLKKAKDSIMPQSGLQKVASIPRKILGGIESLNNTLEVAPRLAEAKRVLKQGGSNDKALFESQDLTTNFSKKGNVTKEADAFIPYLNAAVQGIDKTIRVYNPASSGGKNVANSIAKSIYAITIPTLVLYSVNHADDAYNMLSDYQKDNYFNIPKGDGTFTKIPKPREQGVVFGSFAERMMRAFKDNDPEAFTRFADTIKQNFMPPTDWIVQSAQDIWRTPEGRDWKGNPIVNQSMSNLSPRNQYDENTSEPSKFIGDKLNLSPKKIDATAKSYLGGVASLGLPAVTKGKSVLDTLKSQVTVDPVYSNDIMNDFYSNLNKLQKVANDKDFKSGVKGALDKRQTTDEERKVSEMNKYKKQIDDINKKIPLATTEEKRSLRLQMLDIAKQANNKFK